MRSCPRANLGMFRSTIARVMPRPDERVRGLRNLHAVALLLAAHVAGVDLSPRNS